MTDLNIYLLATIGLAFAFQTFYWLFFMFRIRKHPERSTKCQPLSIIICAKNEAENLSQLIPLLYKQDYRDFQVVVVDDCSTDDTTMILASLKQKYPDLYYTSIPTDGKFHHGKKLAITVGIKAAQHERMVFIDADCCPCSNRWLRELSDSYIDGKEMVIGYGKYGKERGFLNFFIRFETFWNAIQYFGYAKAMRPFMGVGRNLTYTKTLYNQSSKFRTSLQLLSGDDDMFVSEVGTRANTAICYTADSHTISEPEHTWRDWMTQKARHLTTAPYYPWSVKIMLGLEVITRQILIFGSIALLILFNDENTCIAIASIWFVRELTMHLSLGLAQKHMGEKGLWYYALPMDIIVPWIQAFVWIWGIISKHRDTWK